MKLAGLLLRERTRATTAATTTFNSPGIYYMPYGKTTFELQGRSTPGNPTTPGNPPVPGNVSGYNPGIPGNLAYYNYEPGFEYSYWVSGYSGPVRGVYIYHLQTFANGGQYSYTGYDESYNSMYCQPPGYYTDGAFSVYNEWYCTYYYLDNPPYEQFVYQPPYNAAVYNPYQPGNPNFNPTNPGNPPVPGNAGPTTNVLGVTLPGGNSDSSAPVIGFTTISLTYTNAGVPISVPSGGFVTIRNLLP
jgi:hypothetical protein